MFGRSVDVLVADLRSVPADEDLLSVAELGQALAIAASPRLTEFLAARTWMRQRLCEYLGCGADQIRFDSGGRLVISSPTTDLSVDLDYSSHVAMLGVGFRRRLGVSIRSLSGTVPDPEEVTATLAGEELDRFDRSINKERTYLQFQARKRALTNASGDAQPLRTIDTTGLSPLERNGYLITDLSLGDQLVASVATVGEVSLNLSIDGSVPRPANSTVRERVDALIGLTA